MAPFTIRRYVADVRKKDKTIGYPFPGEVRELPLILGPNNLPYDAEAGKEELGTAAAPIIVTDDDDDIMSGRRSTLNGGRGLGIDLNETLTDEVEVEVEVETKTQKSKSAGDDEVCMEAATQQTLAPPAKNNNAGSQHRRIPMAAVQMLRRLLSQSTAGPSIVLRGSDGQRGNRSPVHRGNSPASQSTAGISGTYYGRQSSPYGNIQLAAATQTPVLPRCSHQDQAGYQSSIHSRNRRAVPLVDGLTDFRRRFPQSFGTSQSRKACQPASRERSNQPAQSSARPNSLLLDNSAWGFNRGVQFSPSQPLAHVSGRSPFPGANTGGFPAQVMQPNITTAAAPVRQVNRMSTPLPCVVNFNPAEVDGDVEPKKKRVCY